MGLTMSCKGCFLHRMGVASTEALLTPVCKDHTMVPPHRKERFYSIPAAHWISLSSLFKKASDSAPNDVQEFVWSVSTSEV